MNEKLRYRIVADENMPLVNEAFGTFGDVATRVGRSISRADLADADMLLVRSVTRVDEELLSGTPVRFVASATIGIDHIDLDYLKKNSIGFAYAPGSNADSVAEYVVAALSLHARTTGRPLAGRSIGIIGVGNVGSRVFRHALTLGMKPLLCDPVKQRLTQCDLYRSLDEVLAGADFVTVHVPLIAEGEEKTFHLVDGAFLDAMRSDAVLINTSRGKVADEAALLARRGRGGALFLDVWENEPAVGAGILRAADIATPHIAGYSHDGKVRGTLAVYQAACAWFFRREEWAPEPSVFGEELAVLDPAEGGGDPVTNVVLQAYRIGDDCERMKKMVEMPEERRPLYFDELRRNYPRRNEFPHYSVRAASCAPEVAERLKRLRFNIVD